MRIAVSRLELAIKESCQSFPPSPPPAAFSSLVGKIKTMRSVTDPRATLHLQCLFGVENHPLGSIPLGNVINKASALGLLTAAESAQGGESDWNQFITHLFLSASLPHALLSPPPPPLDQGAWIYTRKFGSSSDDGTVPALSNPQT